MAETCSSREILLIEDDLMDVIILRRVFKEIGVTNKVVHLTNGQQALAYLRDPHHEKPCAILLDLDMPGMTGIEFLEIAGYDDAFKGIPVVVVTASDSQEDRARSLRQRAAAYVVKCSDYHGFRRDIEQLKPYFGSLEPSPHAYAGKMRKEIA